MSILLDTKMESLGERSMSKALCARDKGASLENATDD